MLGKTYPVLLGILLLGGLLVAGCGQADEVGVVKNGDTVKVEYTGRLEDGSIFDSSVGREPLEFTLGQEQLIPGFEKAVIGMKVGESKTVTIPPEEAYGPHNDDLVAVIGRDRLASGVDPAVGQQLQLTQSDGSVFVVTVVEVAETTIKVDGNHFLVGKTLIFEIRLVAIE